MSHLCRIFDGCAPQSGRSTGENGDAVAARMQSPSLVRCVGCRPFRKMLRNSLLVDVINWGPKEKEEAMQMCILVFLHVSPSGQIRFISNLHR